MPRPRERRVERCALIAPLLVLLAAILASLTAQPAAAHGFSSVVYANLTSNETGRITAELQLEYDRLSSGALYMYRDPASFARGTANMKILSDGGMDLRTLNTHEVIAHEPALASAR